MDVIRRNRTFAFRKRVPRRYATVEPRAVVWVSLHTDSETIARQKAPAAWAHMIEAWEARLAGDTDDAERRFEAARNLAQVRGFRYLTADRVAKLPLGDLVERVEASVRGDKVDRVEAAALLGTAKEPAITVNRALELYWGLAKDKTLGMSADQLRRWKNPRIKAVANFVNVVGDKPLADVSGDDMLDFRAWWTERLEVEGITANSANKDLIHLGACWRLVNQMKRLGLDLPLSNLSFKEGEKVSRPPFSTKWIKTKLLGGLGGLNTQARCIVLGMVNTGYRPSEGAGLLPAHIHLGGPVPFISIEPVGRRLKSAYAKRVIPLTGVSLEAFRECPNGFPTYAGKDKVSDTVNKYLRENGLLESPAHKLYSLRHSFEDRMLAGNIDERIRRDLFGHTLDRERYGDGGALKLKHQLIQAIAL